ncbi:MAG TPA: spore germination lipoprotein GerD [Bacillales bacterium]|nr:spore germination lipoprotein GerD [Bacillales bacterium]
MKLRVILTACCLALVLLSGCSGSSAQGQKKMNYQETKKMMIDLLKTDEGKKAIQDVLSDPKMKSQLLMNQDFVKKTIQQTLTSKQGKKFFEQLLKDPKFAKTVAKAMTAQNKKLLKELMKDPDYQKMMMDILKDPEMQKQYLQLMTSQKYRKQMQKVIMESLQSPLFKAKIASELQKVVSEQMKKGTSGGKSQSSGQPQSQAS